MTFIVPDVERQFPPLQGGERAMLEGFLDWHRDTLLHKCSGLTGGQLKQASVEPSNLTLLGLVRHLTDVELGWFCGNLAGEWDHPRYSYQDNADADFEEVGDADPEEAFKRFRVAVDAARAAVAERDLDATFTHPSGKTASLRWIFLHMIEEYARHNGHADLLRERIDGATGG